MEDSPERPSVLTVVVVAGLLIACAFVVGSVFLGGQTSTILSTVGSAIDSSGTGSGSGSDATDGTEPQPTPPTAGADGKIAGLAALPPALLIIRTGTLDIGVVDLDAAVRGADAAVAANGGYVDGSSRSAGDNGDVADARVAYRIPSAAWDATLDAIRKLATTIDSEEIKTEEVSGQVVDLSARIANLRATEAALQAIMAKATQIKDVLDVQEQLTSTRGEIERLVASKADLEDRASFGSLTVAFRLPARAPTPTPDAGPGWNPGQDVELATDKLVSIGQGTTSLGIWLAIVGLPLLIGGSVLAFVALQLARLGRWLLTRRDPATDGPL